MYGHLTLNLFFLHTTTSVERHVYVDLFLTLASLLSTVTTNAEGAMLLQQLQRAPTTSAPLQSGSVLASTATANPLNPAFESGLIGQQQSQLQSQPLQQPPLQQQPLFMPAPAHPGFAQPMPHAGFLAGPPAAPSWNWLYKDPHGNVQGPFTGEEMNDWYTEKYFDEGLPVRRVFDQVFVTLGKAQSSLLFLSVGYICPFSC